MRKVIRTVDGIVDLMLVLFFSLVMLVGLYFLCDTVYVFRHAASPGAGRDAAAGAETPAYTDTYVAWLQLEDTGIDYPVMQGEDNSRFLNTDPYGAYSLTGSIFLDSRNSADFGDSYCLVYGHHLEADLMFGSLDRFYERTYFERHRTGTLRADGIVYRLESFAILRIDAQEDVIFEPQSSESVISLAREKALLFEEPANSHVLALSTCVDDRSTARTVLLLTMTEEGTTE